jgi:hypothetical protein
MRGYVESWKEGKAAWHGVLIFLVPSFLHSPFSTGFAVEIA